jgi:hypothetical protein
MFPNTDNTRTNASFMHFRHIKLYTSKTKDIVNIIDPFYLLRPTIGHLLNGSKEEMEGMHEQSFSHNFYMY